MPLDSTPQQAFVYKMSRLEGTNKKGILKPDADGCYTMCIGALDHASKNLEANGQNVYYSSQGANRFFDKGTIFNSRIQGGFIKAEYGHPKRDGMSERQFLERNLTIDERMTCATFVEIWLVPDYIDPNTNEKCVGIFGKFKPSGPYADALVRDLESAGVNVCFSIRSLTTRKIINGRLCKLLHTVITFDFVNEPGISAAEKLVSPSMEQQHHHLDGPADIEVTEHTLRKVLDRASAGKVSVESGMLHLLKEVEMSFQRTTRTHEW